MDAPEYLAFIPLLFYGIALADLLGQWRRFFDGDYFYLPYFLTTVIFTEVAIWNVFIYLEVVGQLEGIHYFQYWLYLAQPSLFLVIVSALTPEPENKDTELYFKKRMPIVFGLMAIYILSHLFAGLSHSFDSHGATAQMTVVRVIAVVLCLVTAIVRKPSLVYVLTVIWVISLFARM